MNVLTVNQNELIICLIGCLTSRARHSGCARGWRTPWRRTARSHHRWWRTRHSRGRHMRRSSHWYLCGCAGHSWGHRWHHSGNHSQARRRCTSASNDRRGCGRSCRDTSSLGCHNSSGRTANTSNRTLKSCRSASNRSSCWQTTAHRTTHSRPGHRSRHWNSWHSFLWRRRSFDGERHDVLSPQQNESKDALLFPFQTFRSLSLDFAKLFTVGEY